MVGERQMKTVDNWPSLLEFARHEWNEKEARRKADLKLMEVMESLAPRSHRQVRPTRSEMAPVCKDFLTIPELAQRWRIARPTVYNRLKAAGIKVLDFAPRGGRGRKVVPMGEILKIEGQ